MWEFVIAAGRRRARPVLLDLGLAIALCLLDLVVAFDSNDPRARSVIATALYAAVGYLALAARRRWPGPVFAVVLVHSLLATVVVPGYLPTLGLWLALYTVAAHGDRWPAALALAAMAPHAALNVADEVQRHQGADRVGAVISSIVLSTGISLAIAGVGRWVRWSVRQRILAAQHAAAEAVSSERSRIARDLHDVVAHAVTLMVLQAGGAARLLRSEPDRASTALDHVDELGQQAIFELHRLLGLLAPEPAESAEAAVRPGLRDLACLVDQVRASGLRVERSVTGEPAGLEPGVDLAAFRIAQEALTNAVRYADPRHPVQVEVRWRPFDVEIAVLNHTLRALGPSLPSGRGIVGIRERVRISGGSVDAGPQPDGRFLVGVRLPLTTRRPADPGSRPAAIGSDSGLVTAERGSVLAVSETRRDG
jgi:signal transduction histidine kinase